MQKLEHKNKPSTAKHSLQESMSKHKQNYQKYLNNIYETIKQKQFYIHRSQTPTEQILNNNEVSKLSGRSEKTSNKNEGLKSLPKLSAKDTMSNEVLQVVLSSCENKTKRSNSNISPVKKAVSSQDKKANIKNRGSSVSKKIYQFGNFPEPKPSITSHLYANSSLRQSKELTKNSTIAKQKMLEQPNSTKISLSQRHKDKKSPIYNQNVQQKSTLYQKISKDNMNLLGLNVEKVNYSEKRDLLNSNRRFIYIKMTKAEQNEDYFQGQETQFLNNQTGNVLNFSQNQQNSQNQVLDNPNPDNALQKNYIDMDLCEQLVSQKMQFSKRNVIQGQQRRLSNVSPSKQRRIAPQNDRKNSNLNGDQELNPIYETRYKKYLDIILKLTFSYRKYGQLDSQIHANLHIPLRNDKKYRAWIGNGNNGNMLKALIKRRFWWQIVDQKSWSVNFLWTQLKNNDYFKAQSQNLKLKKNKMLKSESQIDRSWTKMDESTSLSASNDKQSSSKLSPMRKVRAQSSLPGSIASKSKQLRVSAVKRNRGGISEQELNIFQRVFNKQEIQEYKQSANKLENKLFNQKLDILNIEKFNAMDCRMHNHLMNNFYLGNKKALFHNLKEYYSLVGGDLFKTVPLTFHIKKGVKDPQYKRFLAYYKKRQAHIKKQQKQMQLGLEEKRKMRNIWIVKPGENTNRGNGITVIDEMYELNSIFKSEGKHNDGSQKTFIVQLYIDRPLLYKKRKFDIRHYMMITHVHGIMKGYWFEEGYIRTSGYEFDVEDFQRQIHLTNDAVQKYTPNYGKFQPANKISYAEFQKYLDQTYPKKNYSFYDQILPRMKQICLDSIKSAFLKISPEKLEHNFELFGMDFMIDNDFVPWLIEINTNPCLELTNPLQSRLLPQVVDEALRLTLDVIYPPPCHYPNTYRHLVPQTSNMKAQLIFDERLDGEQIRKLYQKRKINEKALLQEIGQLQDDEVYEDEGQQDIKLEEFLQ